MLCLPDIAVSNVSVPWRNADHRLETARLLFGFGGVDDDDVFAAGLISLPALRVGLLLCCVFAVGVKLHCTVPGRSLWYFSRQKLAKRLDCPVHVCMVDVTAVGCNLL